MEIIKRREVGYFLAIDEYKILIDRINNSGYFDRYYFDMPVTESVYFTLRDDKYSLYNNLYIRLRRYTRNLSESITIDESESYMEMKEKLTIQKLTLKRRYLLKSNDIVGILSCFNLYPFAGIQVERLHWQSEDLRITLDPDMYFFGFGDNIYKGCRMGKLGELKLELKFGRNSDNVDNKFEEKILSGLNFRKEILRNYIEERIRKCRAEWIQKINYK